MKYTIVLKSKAQDQVPLVGVEHQCCLHSLKEVSAWLSAPKEPEDTPSVQILR